MEWWKRRRNADEGVVDLRGIDDVIDVRLDAEHDGRAQAPEGEPPAQDRALEEWERSAALVEYPPDFKQ